MLERTIDQTKLGFGKQSSYYTIENDEDNHQEEKQIDWVEKQYPFGERQSLDD